MYQIPNLKYKTTLCLNWLQGTPCEKANNCYFAHGQSELRKIQENQQVIASRNQIYLQYQSNNNYKTVYCRFFAKGSFFQYLGQCKLGAHCTFAHQKRQKRRINKKQMSPPVQYTPMYSYQAYSVPYFMPTYDNYTGQYFQESFVDYNDNIQPTFFDNQIQERVGQTEKKQIKSEQTGINQKQESVGSQKQIIKQNNQVQQCLNLQMSKISLQN